MIEKRQTNMRFLDAWNIQKTVLFIQTKPLQDKSTKPTRARSIRSAGILVRSLTPPHPPRCRRTVWKLSVRGNDSVPIKGGHLMGSSFKGGNLRKARHVWHAPEYLPRFYVNCILIFFLYENQFLLYFGDCDQRTCNNPPCHVNCPSLLVQNMFCVYLYLWGCSYLCV